MFTASPNVATGSNAFTATASISGGFHGDLQRRPSARRFDSADAHRRPRPTTPASSSTDEYHQRRATITGTAVDGTNARLVALVGKRRRRHQPGRPISSATYAAGNTFTLSPTAARVDDRRHVISQGTHTLHLRDTDIAGNTTDLDFTFTFDTDHGHPDDRSSTRPPTPAPSAINETNLAAVSLSMALAEANARPPSPSSRRLRETPSPPPPPTAPPGRLPASRVSPSPPGANTFTVVATDPAGNTATSVHGHDHAATRPA